MPRQAAKFAGSLQHVILKMLKWWPAAINGSGKTYCKACSFASADKCQSMNEKRNNLRVFCCNAFFGGIIIICLVALLKRLHVADF